ncbi:hypothetical protein CHS0354_027701 [Potamilus streckersoni]|uniref:Large ribosomal subunit protein mL62 n=1 Tax=Potamilus streckersoni TaxID=2493646 RepID=A0AAE0WB29_9BIVA|nr:hypothetical protein CHS0354_027701 [Potamilus streckersoni]
MISRSCCILKSVKNNSVTLLRQTYKSDCALEKIYPNSNPDPLQHVEFKDTKFSKKAIEGSFSGYVPIDQLEIKYLKSSGAGGQHVNKVNTKVEVRFNVDRADWIPEWIKPKLKENEHGKINKEGELIITSDKTRKQLLNQADCMDKIRTIIFKASIKPKEPTQETLESMKERLEKARREALRQKRDHSIRKQLRQTSLNDF